MTEESLAPQDEQFAAWLADGHDAQLVGETDHGRAERQSDPDQSRLRHETALARLSEAEKETWRKFWAAVTSLLERAQGGATL